MISLRIYYVGCISAPKINIRIILKLLVPLIMLIKFCLAYDYGNNIHLEMLDEPSSNSNMTNNLAQSTTERPISITTEQSDPNDFDNNNSSNSTSSNDDTSATNYTTQNPSQSSDNVTKLTDTATPSDLPNSIPPSKIGPPGQTTIHNEQQKLSPVYIILIYCLFILGVTMIKIFYSKITLLKNRLNESSILIVFGAIWGVVSQYIPYHNLFPKFNSRLYFHLFLPSMIMESSLSLGNRSFFLALFPILTHTILGTVLHAALLGSTVYGFGQSDLFDQRITKDHVSQSVNITSHNQTSINLHDIHISLAPTECMLLGTILSSLDFNTIQAVSQEINMNRKLYYLISGESIINNAVVVAFYDLVNSFMNDERITVVRIYTACITFFIMFVGAIMMGLLFALLALFLTSQITIVEAHQQRTVVNMVVIEASIVILLAYTSYIVSDLIGISSITTMITFGLLQDQYIRHNLSYRSQVACLHVISALRTLSDILIYTLLGIELVDGSSIIELRSTSTSGANPGGGVSGLDKVTVEEFWNYKFIATVTILTILYRLVVVLALSSICNWCSSIESKLTLYEQLVMALGGLKGSIAFALTARLAEKSPGKNQVLFVRTVLTIITFSITILGNLTRPIVLALNIARETEPKAPIFFRVQSKINDHLVEGLDCIIGYNKTLYERFIDFNELHIKPWLTKRGAHTNWLLSQYNQLAIDEIVDKQALDHLNAIENLNLLKKSLRRTTLSTGYIGNLPAISNLFPSVIVDKSPAEQFNDNFNVIPLQPPHQLHDSDDQLEMRDQEGKYIKKRNKSQHLDIKIKNRANTNDEQNPNASTYKQRLDNQKLKQLVSQDLGIEANQAQHDNKSLNLKKFTRKKGRITPVTGVMENDRIRYHDHKMLNKQQDSLGRRRPQTDASTRLNLLEESSDTPDTISSGKDFDEITSQESERGASFRKNQLLNSLDARSKYDDNLRSQSKLKDNIATRGYLSTVSASSSLLSDSVDGNKNEKLMTKPLTEQKPSLKPNVPTNIARGKFPSSLTGNSKLGRKQQKLSSHRDSSIAGSKINSNIQQARLINIDPKRQHRLMNCEKGLDSIVSSRLEREQLDMKPGPSTRLPVKEAVKKSPQPKAGPSSRQVHRRGDVRSSEQDHPTSINKRQIHHSNNLNSIISIFDSDSESY